MTSKLTTQTELTAMRHLEAAADTDIDRLLAGYTDESVLFTPEGEFRGLEQLRGYFCRVFSVLPEGWFDSFTMMRREIDGDMAYLVWKAEPAIPMATDTFVIRGGKISAQTLTVYPSRHQMN